MVLLLCLRCASALQTQICDKKDVSHGNPSTFDSTQLKFADYFRPVFRVNNEEWQRIESAIVFVPFILRWQTKEDDTELHFDFHFPKASEVFFAYSYPFSYEDNEKMLRNVQKEVKSLKNIYYKD